MQERFDWRDPNAILLMFVGLILIQGWSIGGEALGFLGGPIRVIAWLMLLFGFLIKYVAWTTGLGAILLHYLSPLPVASATSGSLPPVPPGPVPPPPEPADWEDTAFDTESTEKEPEAVDRDEAYLPAGAADTADDGEPEDDSAPETDVSSPADEETGDSEADSKKS